MSKNSFILSANNVYISCYKFNVHKTEVVCILHEYFTVFTFIHEMLRMSNNQVLPKVLPLLSPPPMTSMNGGAFSCKLVMQTEEW